MLTRGGGIHSSTRPQTQRRLQGRRVSSGSKPQGEEQLSSINHTKSVALAKVLAHAHSQARVGEGGTAESASSSGLAVAADIAIAHWNVGTGTVVDGDISRDVGCDIVRDADDRIGDDEGTQAEEDNEGSHFWVGVPWRCRVDNVCCENILCKGSDSFLCQKVRMIQRMLRGSVEMSLDLKDPKKKRGPISDCHEEGTRPYPHVWKDLPM